MKESNGDHEVIELGSNIQAIAQGVVVGVSNWQQRLEANKMAFVNEFTNRPRFTAAFPPAMSAAHFQRGKVHPMSLSFNRPIRPLARHRAWPALLCVVAVAATSSLPLRHTSTMAAGQKPGSASGNVAAQPQTEMPADLREAVERSRYRISEQERAAVSGGYEAMNPAQAFSATFTDAGLCVQPHSASVKAESADSELTASAEPEVVDAESVAGWQWGMTLRGYGYGEQMQEVAPAAQAAADNRIEYRRGELTEWYVNDQRGLEQGFTLAARPAGSKGREPLVVRLSVEGDLRAEGSRDNQHIYFVGEDGARVLSYSGLVAFDALGKALAAQMRVAEGEVRLEVEDEGAEFR